MTQNHEMTIGGEQGLAAIDDVGQTSAAAREKYEIEAMFTIAVHKPRDEESCRERILKACKRPNFAAKALYSFPRGGQTVSGPSVILAREMARCWGNIRSGIRVVQMDEQYVHIKGWALDVEANAYIESEAKFKKLIYRKDGGWLKPDERQLRELINKHGAMAMRNAILQVLPADLVDEACTCASGGLVEEQKKTDPKKIAASIVKNFATKGVTKETLEVKYGNMEKISDFQYKELRGIYQSIDDGNSKVSEYFPKGKSQDQGRDDHEEDGDRQDEFDAMFNGAD